VRCCLTNAIRIPSSPSHTHIHADQPLERSAQLPQPHSPLRFAGNSVTRAMSSSSGGVPPSAREVVLGTVVPVIGGVVALIMYASPLKAVHTARKQKALGVSRVRALQRADMATQHAQPPQRPPPVLPAPPRRTSTRCPLLLRLPAQLAGTATGLQRQTTTCSFPTCLASLPRFSRRCHATRWQAQRCERKQPRRCMQDTTHGRTRMRTQHQQHTVRCWLRACVCVCVCVCVCRCRTCCWPSCAAPPSSCCC
jgi:hypothetical protein